MNNLCIKCQSQKKRQKKKLQSCTGEKIDSDILNYYFNQCKLFCLYKTDVLIAKE